MNLHSNKSPEPMRDQSQLHAAVVEPVALLLPMVRGLDELRAVKAIVEEAKCELTKEGHSFD